MPIILIVIVIHNLAITAAIHLHIAVVMLLAAIFKISIIIPLLMTITLVNVIPLSHTSHRWSRCRKILR